MTHLSSSLGSFYTNKFFWFISRLFKFKSLVTWNETPDIEMRLKLLTTLLLSWLLVQTSIPWFHINDPVRIYVVSNKTDSDSQNLAQKSNFWLCIPILRHSLELLAPQRKKDTAQLSRCLLRQSCADGAIFGSYY